MTKEVFAKGVSKVVPVIGGVVSGSITLATMLPMGKRLANTLDEAKFSYSQKDFEEDWEDIVEIIDEETEDEDSEGNVSESNKEKDFEENSVLDKIQQAKKLLDEGIITSQEFSEIKAKLISEM